MSSDCSPRMDEKGDEQPADLTTDAHKAISTTPATKVAPNDDMDMGDNVNAFTNNDSTIIAQEADEIDNVLDDIQYLNQATVEKNTLAQARRDQKAGEDERDQHIIEKVTVALEKLRQKKLGIANQLGARFVPESKRRTLNVELVKINHKLTEVTADIEIAKDRMKQRKLKFIAQSEDGIDYSRRLKPGETEREFRIRTGLITPFSNIGVGREGVEESELAKELLQEELDAELRTQGQTSDRAPDSHRVLNKPGFQSQDQAPKKIDMSVLPRIRKRKAPGVTSEEKSKKIARRSIAADVADSAPSLGWNQNSSERSTLSPRPQVVVEKEPVTVLASHSDSEVNPADFTTEDEDEEEATFNSRKTREIPVKAALVIDDGNEAAYQRRLAKWVAGRSAAREAEHEKNGNVGQEDDRDEWLKVCPTHEDFTLRDGVVVPGDIWHALYQFQRTGVQWLSELHALESGGIVADEMGLGKTIQAISMIAALHHSDKLQRPALIVCPATVMQQWVSEFHTWWPPVRVSILHKTGSGMTVRKSKNSVYDAADDDRAIAGSGVKDQKGARGIVDRVLRQGHVLVTSYQGLESFGELLRDVQWGYVVLDEGHKIKNPAAKVTQYCKQLQSRHRILMSGTPMQNNLTEFWSLFDFVAPMMLGSLVAFKENFEQPIKDGSLKNASNLEILHANTAAKFLKETISKHFLQRLKADVASDLPPKVEQTVVVRLIKQQAEDVQKLLKSELIESCVAKRTEALVGIDQYKKLCNHPHLLLEDFYKARLGNKYGDYKLSGKMIIARQLVYRWKRDGNKMLIFCQTKQMLDIIEKMLKDCRDICYLRMDGDTKIQDRNALVDDFNGNSGINVFLLTTKVGGQGLNLISANGVIIYDPDWNPSVDIQARERIYRIGQTKPVYIFRLIAKGTIEEKILQRQIFKKVMSEKVLSDATLKSDYSHSQLKDLFTYNNDDSVLEGVGNEKKGAGYRIIGKADGETRFFDGRIEAGTGLDQVGAAQLKYARTVQEASTKKRETADIASDPSKPAATDSAIGPSAKSLGDPLADAERQKAEFRDIGASIAKSAGVDYVDVDDEDAAGTPKEADPLDRLFKNSGVFSVLSQGTNMGKDEKDMSRGDKIYTKNVAKKLQEEMRRNEETNRETKAGQVSWTGQVGTVGAPVEKPKWLLGRNASGLTRNARNGTSGPSAKRSREPTPAAAPPPSPLEVKKEELKKKIVDFMKRQTGLAVPRMMLDQQFSPQLKLGEDRSLFMSALRDVAESVSSRNEISSRWALKARYRV